jgi:hypothetical protein
MDGGSHGTEGPQLFGVQVPYPAVPGPHIGIGSEGPDFFGDTGAVKDENTVHGAERSKGIGPEVLAQDGPGGALEGPHAAIGIKGDQQPIPQAGGLFQEK